MCPRTITHMGLPRGPAFVVLFLAMVLGAWVTAACNSPARIDQAAASQIARDYFASAQAPGATVGNVKSLSIDLGSDGGRPAWSVNISGDVMEAGSTIAITYYWWLYVDAETGEVRLFAQG